MPYYSPTEIERQRALAMQLATEPRQRSGVVGGLADVLKKWGAYRGGVEAAKKEQSNQQLQQDEMNQLLSALRGDPALGMMKPGETPAFQSPAASQLAAQLALQKAMKEPKAPIKVSAGESLVDPNTMKPVYSAPEPVDYNKMFLPDGSFNEQYFNAQAALRQAGKPVTNVNNNMAQDYLSARIADQAKAFADLEKSADSAVKANRALERFIQASANGTEGGAQPIISGLQNFFASFGFNPEQLKSTAVMEQAVGEILGAKMAELGARGLTDKDMEILRQALPRVNTSHEARLQVADILKRSNDSVINDYYSRAQAENQKYPDANFIRPSWFSPDNVDQYLKKYSK